LCPLRSCQGQRGQNLAAECCKKLKERTQGNCGSQEKPTVTSRKRAWGKRIVVGKNWTRAKAEQGSGEHGCSGRDYGRIKDLGGRRLLYLRKKRTTTNGIGEWS
jgi:hypothetical protein